MLHSRRISDFNPYNRDYPVHFVVDCLIHGLWQRSRRKRPSTVLSAKNGPATWYSYTISNPREAFSFCLRVLRLAQGSQIIRDNIQHLFKKSTLSTDERALIIAESIQRHLGKESDTLEEFLRRDYAPWADAILNAIRR